MKIKRYLVLVSILVGMGLGTVWWKSRTLSMGYEAVRLQKVLDGLGEEESLEDSLLARMTAPDYVTEKAGELGVQRAGEHSSDSKTGGRRGEGNRRPVNVANR